MNSTTIAHLRCQYLIAQEHPAPDDIRSCLDRVARDYLPVVCSALLTRLLDPEDSSLWFIRRLDVAVNLHVGSLDMLSLAEQWGRQIVKSIIRALTLPDEEPGGHDELVKHFPHQNAYVAQFICDLVAGCAWEQWYYHAFDGLRSLSPSAAIRTVLAREAEQAAEILALLVTYNRLEVVMQCLSESDARTISDLCFPTPYAMNIDGEPAQLLHAEKSRLRADLSSIDIEEGMPNAQKAPLSKQEADEHVERSPLYANMPLTAEEEELIRDDVSLLRKDKAREHAEMSSSGVEEAAFLSPQSVQNVSEKPLSVSEVPIENGEDGDGRYHVVANEQRQIVELLLTAWSKAGLQLPGVTVATPQNALRLYTTLWRQVAGYGTSSIREAIEHLLRFAEVMRSIAQPGLLVSALLHDDLTAVVELLQAARLFTYLENLSYLQQVAAGDTAFVRHVVSTVATSMPLTHQRAMETDRTEQRMTTLLGGLFLLLPSFIDLKLHTLFKEVSTINLLEEQRMAWIRYLIFLKCFGLFYQQWPEIARDPILALVADCDETPLHEMLHQLNALITPQMLWGWQRLLMGQLARNRSVEGRYLYAELLEMEDRRIVLIRDMRYDTWLFITSVSHAVDVLQAVLVHGLRIVQDATGLQAEYLVLGTGLGQLPPMEALDKQVHCLWTAQGVLAERTRVQANSEGEESLELWDGNADSIARDVQIELLYALRRLKNAEKDLRYLQLYKHNQPMFEQFDFELTLSLIARTVIRSFARRLPGFDQSSPEYLYQNFLTGTSTVVAQVGLLEVQLARCPLHLVLRIAGMHAQHYTLPWRDDMQVIVTLAKA